MADNVAITAGTGTAIATDEIQVSGTGALSHVQYVKLVDGTLNGTGAIGGDAANGLDVDVTRLPALPAGTNNIGDVDVLTVPTDPFGANADAASATGSISAKLKQLAVGIGTHDSPEPASGPYILMSATTGLTGITLVANDDATHVHSGVDGVILVRPHCALEDIVTGNASSTGDAPFPVIAAGATGVKHYLTSCTITNTSTTAIFCELEDGATAKWTVPVPAQGGATITFPVPIPGSAATAWNCDPSAATTTIYCSMVAFKSKV